MRNAIAAVLIGLAGLARAEGEPPGRFDYYVMALSWSPNWCAIEGDAKRSPQCDPRHADFGWTLHGLWPQYHRGWPTFLPDTQTPTEPVVDGNTMADIMGTSGLAWYQWKKARRVQWAFGAGLL